MMWPINFSYVVRHNPMDGIFRDSCRHAGTTDLSNSQSIPVGVTAVVFSFSKKEKTLPNCKAGRLGGILNWCSDDGSQQFYWSWLWSVINLNNSPLSGSHLKTAHQKLQLGRIAPWHHKFESGIFSSIAAIADCLYNSLESVAHFCVLQSADAEVSPHACRLPLLWTLLNF